MLKTFDPTRNYFAVLSRNFLWNVKHNGLVTALQCLYRTALYPDFYRTWWDKEIVKLYRLRTLEGMAFYKSLEGLPGIFNKLPPKRRRPDRKPPSLPIKLWRLIEDRIALESV